MAASPVEIGKYRIEGVAGRGAMGIVYVGHDPYVDRKVAIKVQAQPLADEDDGESTSANQARRMFFNEAQSAGALDHPNILRIYDAGDANGQLYIAMEYVADVETLKSYCVAEKLLPIETAVEHMINCAEALDYAHQRGVTHRDIKPANLLLTKDGDVKIGDFGIAQRTQTDQTQIAGWFGSPKYMSPEQARDDSLTHQTDIYSLGVVMYELLSGTQPFNASGIQGLINNILNKDPMPIQAVRPELPDLLATVVHRALEKDLTKRYQSGKELAADLHMVLEVLRDPLVGMSQEEKFHAARSLSFFSEFSDSELSEVIGASRWESHPLGTAVFNQGEIGNAFYVIVSGHMWVKCDDKEIAMLSDGECFGEMAYLSKGKRSATVIAADKLAVMKIEAPASEWASLPCQLRLNKVFLQILIKRLQQSSTRLAKQID